MPHAKIAIAFGVIRTQLLKLSVLVISPFYEGENKLLRKSEKQNPAISF